MSDTYTENFHHFVWATKKREPLITPELEPVLYGYIRQKCATLDVFVHALNGTADHVHLACSLPTTISIANLLETIKGGSAHFVNHLPDASHCLYWQRGYGWITLNSRDLPRVIAYVENQKAHHEDGSLLPKLERAQPKPNSTD